MKKISLILNIIILTSVFVNCVELIHIAKALDPPVYIVGNLSFSTTAASRGWPGNGSSTNPYIISTLHIDTSAESGIYIENTDVYFIIKNCTVSGDNDGINIYRVSNGYLLNNTCHNNGIGILVWDSSYNIVMNNTCYQNGQGIRIHTGSSHNSLIKNNCSYNDYGIFIHQSTYNNITENTCTYNQNFGYISFLNTNHNTISNNDFSYNYQNGIKLEIDCNSETIRNNTCINNQQYGIHIKDSDDDLLMFNIISHNKNYGTMLDDCLNINVTYNDFIENNNGFVQGFDDLGMSTWRYNFWNDHNNTDGNLDGFADSPYTLDGGFTTDSFPVISRISPDFIAPSITILSPTSHTYDQNNVWLNYTINEVILWVGYVLDGNPNVTITGNTTIEVLPDGLHNITIYATDLAGNVGFSSTIWFSIDTQAPAITLLNPLNTTFSRTSIDLNFTANEPLFWIGFSLDGTTNVTITGNTTIESLSDGSHCVTVYATDLAGNEGSSFTIWFSIDTQAPVIKLLSPGNSSYAVNDLWLNFTINEPTSWVGYSLDSNSNITIFGATQLSSLLEGSHSIIIYATDLMGKTGFSSKIWFTIDTQAPVITLLSPGNSSYTVNDLWLNFTINEPTSWVGYSLDGYSNVTITGNTLLESLSDASHVIVLYITDLAGNPNSSLTLWFTIDTTPPIISINLILANEHPIDELDYINTTEISIYSDVVDGSPVELSLYINGLKIGTQYSNWTWGRVSLNQGDGLYNVTLYAKDALNNSNSFSFFLNLLTSVPIFELDDGIVSSTLNNPLSGSFTVYVSINFEIIDKVEFKVESNVADWIDITASLSHNASHCWFDWDSVTVEDGQHTLYLRVIDKVGNVGSQSYVIFVNNQVTTAFTTSIGSELTSISSELSELIQILGLVFVVIAIIAIIGVYRMKTREKPISIEKTPIKTTEDQKRIITYVPPVEDETYFCQLCQEKHPLSKSHYQCVACKRNQCPDCYSSSVLVGRNKCVNCSGDLIYIKIKNDELFDQKK